MRRDGKRPGPSEGPGRWPRTVPGAGVPNLPAGPVGEAAGGGVESAPPPVSPSLAVPTVYFEFFNNLSGKLEIDLSKPAEKIGRLSNERAPAEAKIRSLKLAAEVYENDDVRPLTDEELKLKVFEAPTIRLRGEADHPDAVVEHAAPDGRGFTVRQLLTAVEETERQTRGRSEWFGGVDISHVYFEGLEPAETGDGSWQILWGS